jgi:ABC-type glutathione transport system ATPase component
MASENKTLADSGHPVLAARNVTLQYASRRLSAAGRAPTVALRDVSIGIFVGKTLALVGPSGAGKSSLARCLLLLEEPQSGQIFYRDSKVLRRDREALKPLRREVHLIFQDSASALNPGLTVEEILSEPLVIHKEPTHDRKKSLRDAMEQMELPGSWLRRRPLGLSGGQRQRVAIARALVLQPKVLLLDEALNALDLSAQGQIANLLRALQARHGIGYLYITHDLSMAGVMADEVAVMKDGRIMRQGRSPDVFLNELRNGGDKFGFDLPSTGEFVASCTARDR